MVKKSTPRSKKKIALCVFVALIACLLVYSGIWYFMTHKKYGAYTEGLDINETGGLRKILSPVYYSGDGEHEYTVAFPGYLSYVGNLGVSEAQSGMSLLIWPSIFGESEYGVILYDEGQDHQIMIKREGKAEDGSQQGLVDRYSQSIEELFEFAEKQWGDI